MTEQVRITTKQNRRHNAAAEEEKEKEPRHCRVDSGTAWAVFYKSEYNSLRSKHVYFFFCDHSLLLLMCGVCVCVCVYVSWVCTFDEMCNMYLSAPFAHVLI